MSFRDFSCTVQIYTFVDAYIVVINCSGHLIEDSKLDGFTPGSIHAASVRAFWLETLNCGSWVEEVLSEGYKIPFTSLPGPYEEDNNASVKRQPVVVADIVMDLMRLGVVEFVSTKPRCVSPLGLVTKEVDGVVKHRLVFDASRWINLHTLPPPVKLVHLARAIQMTQRDDFQAVFDLKSAYYNVKIAPEHVTFLGAAVVLNSKKQYFVFKHLPFGLNSAVHAITKLWKPLLAYLHLCGVRMSIYIDDGRILARTREQIESHRLLTYAVVQKAGWQIAWEKSDDCGEGAQVKKYLGFVIDSKLMKVEAPETKLLEVKAFIARALSAPVLVKTLSSLLGKIVALSPSHGSVVRICTRSSYVILEAQVEQCGWTGFVFWTHEARRELRFFMDMLWSFNGIRISDDLTDVRLDLYLDRPLASDPNATAYAGTSHVAVSDASNVRAVVKWLQGPLQDSTSLFQFSLLESGQSSGQRELLAVLRFLQHDQSQQLLRGAHVLWLTDSANVVSFLTKGSPKSHLQSMIFDILILSTNLNCVISPVHLYRSDERVQQADFLSKIKDSDNWSVDARSFDRFNADFHFDVDLFADLNNRKVPTFVSKFYNPEALAVDAFTISWPGMCWVCPPVSLIQSVLRRIRTSRCQGLLVVPNWPASDYYCDLFDGTSLKAPFTFIDEFTPYIFQNEGARNTPLFGTPSFKFFALYFNTL